MSPEVPANTRCFIDANILLYHIIVAGPQTALCTELLKRAARGEVRAVTSSMVISETLHGVMLAEVRARFATTKPLTYVQRHPELIAQLVEYPRAADEMHRLGIELLQVDATDWVTASRLAGQLSLLTNDACAVALMRRHGIGHLATNDDDFDDVPGIVVHKPR